MKHLILVLILTAYGCFGQKTVEQLEAEMLDELVDVHRKIKFVQVVNGKLVQGKGLFPEFSTAESGINGRLDNEQSD